MTDLYTLSVFANLTRSFTTGGTMATLTGTDKTIDKYIGIHMDCLYYRYWWSDDLPNHLMWFRLILAPVQITLLITGLQGGDITWVFLALIVLVFQAFTDLVDGYIARKHDCTSTSGARWDPFADKMMVLPAMLLLISWSKPSFVNGYAGWWLTMLFFVIIIIQEVVSTLWYLFRPGGKSNPWGKLKLWCQVFATGIGMIVAMFVINGDARFVCLAMISFMAAAIIFASLSLHAKFTNA